ncbi:MAG: hypothetical protein Q9166_007152 [cf. Caloplaca sp. 2 TL-2023]
MAQHFSHIRIPAASQAHHEPGSVTTANGSSTMAKRKAPSRAAKKDPYDLNQLLTSDSSRLIDVDLHGMLSGFFSDPENWVLVSDEDKEYIRSLLPSHVELNDDGTIPQDFWKYNAEFRLDCRNLQEDLRAGRMDPEWQLQAHQAMEERAAGDFDDFKEREFEEFWGQKQKIDWKYLAGDASKVRLDEMLRAELFKTGDVWSFDHTFRRGEESVPIQKDQIVKLDKESVTLAIPPGQLKFARRLSQFSTTEPNKAKMPPPSTIPSSTADTADEGTTMEEASVMTDEVKTEIETTPLADCTKVSDPMEVHQSSVQTEVGEENTKSDISVVDNAKSPAAIPDDGSKQQASTQPTAPDSGPASPENMTEHLKPTTTSTNDANEAISIAKDYDVILWKGTNLNALAKKILAIDGRAKSDARTASTWRDIRCRRNEQDMGSLFEMRDEYYAYKVTGKDTSG